MVYKILLSVSVYFACGIYSLSAMEAAASVDSPHDPHPAPGPVRQHNEDGKAPITVTEEEIQKLLKDIATRRNRRETEPQVKVSVNDVNGILHKIVYRKTGMPAGPFNRCCYAINKLLTEKISGQRKSHSEWQIWPTIHVMGPINANGTRTRWTSVYDRGCVSVYQENI